MTLVSPLARGAALIGVATLLAACTNAPEPAIGAGGGASSEPTMAAGGEGDAAGATATPAPTGDADTADGGGADQAEPGAVYGTAVVDGVEYALHELRRCEPTDVEQVERELELTARGHMPAGEGYDGGDWVQIDVYVQTIAGTDFDAVSWAGPEGAFGTNDAAEVGYSGDQVSGSAVLVDSLTQEQSISVTYDIEVPDELLDCRP